MSKLFIGSIDLNKIDKSKVVATDKNGNPFSNGAKYLNISVWVNDEPDQFGNSVSIQTGGKEDKIYIGNAKEYKKDGQAQTNQQPSNNEPESDLPW